MHFRKDVKYNGHQENVLSLAINTNGDVIASGDASGKIILWTDQLKPIHYFTEHKKSITGKNIITYKFF